MKRERERERERERVQKHYRERTKKRRGNFSILVAKGGSFHRFIKQRVFSSNGN